MYSPLEAGCALVRDAEALTRAFAYHPPYYHFEERAVNFVDCGPQNSRGFRALKVWLALRQVGARGYRQMIADDIRLSSAMAAAIDRHPELELMTQALSITTFRYVPADLRPQRGDNQVEQYLNSLNESLLDRLQRGGELFVSNAVIRGRYALRACIVNFHTRGARRGGCSRRLSRRSGSVSTPSCARWRRRGAARHGKTAAHEARWREGESA